MTHIRPVVLCGGSGTRLWPISRESYPKQFVPLIDNKSLLELTLNRIAHLGDPIIIANEEHRFLVKDVISSAIPGGQILLEPEGRNTAAAIACAAYFPGVDKEDLLLFLPADHYIPDSKKFICTIKNAVSIIKQGYLVIFGITPDFPSTSYGYIQKGKKFGDSDSYEVKLFLEKPTITLAKKFIKKSDFYWNSGIILCRADDLRRSLDKYAPDIKKICEAAMSVAVTDNIFIRPNKKLFLSCRSQSIDYAVMEKNDHIAMVKFEGAWSDLGTWNAVADLNAPDELGNQLVGKALTLNTSDTFVYAPHKPVVALGVENMIIVDSPDALLISHKNYVEQVKDAVSQLKIKGFNEAIAHKRIVRPWGWYDSIDSGSNFQVKRIAVKPGASLSLQLHHHRSEHWVVIKGMAKVVNGNQHLILGENQSTYIPIGVKHRLENIGPDTLEIIEVQSGDYLGEDDIIRFEDIYGRN